MDGPFVGWSVDYLTNRPPFVPLHNCVPEVEVCSMEATQENVLVLYFFTINGFNFTYSMTQPLRVFVSEGDSVDYWSAIRNFVSWCENCRLWLNTSKTKIDVD